MNISVTGISHHETPIAVRERFAFAADELAPALGRIKDRFSGAAILSTCNRTELYLASEQPVGEQQGVDALVAARQQDALEGLSFYHLKGVAAVEHLCRVAASIDSLVVGESEILGQVREAFSAATAAKSANPVLARLFHTAMRVGRRARTETEISGHGLSIAAIAVSLSRAALGDLRRKTVLVVGAGEAGQRAASALAQSGAGRLLVTTRTASRANEIASQLNAIALPFSERATAIAESDVVISATSAPEAVIARSDVESAMRSRPERPLVMVDIAVPRDIEPSVRGLPNVHLFDIDDLQATAERNLQARQGQVAPVTQIMQQEAGVFASWLDQQKVVPTVAALQQQAERARLHELERTLARLPDLTEAQRRRIESMSKALVKRLLHNPVTRLRRPAAERHVAALRDLFKLDDDAEG